MFKQSLFLARTNKSYQKPDIWGREQVGCTAFERLAYLINSDWKHSMYWPFENDDEILPAIKKSLDSEIDSAHTRLAGLIEAKEILGSIEPKESNQ
jgi:hypothetical protein